ncbi:hypothetical protein [Streptomyces sp. H27-D2]|uniref:hypothetical protein n=1 Tax=Streptomyces sp. H27-D2 TaxID=3046304 RepID=UPI002DB6B515|nr:hypothetical protein [Streptomyces sp. H27-D2]MEC4020626.1 hypothetical protein [Streptomyces sp. H27-D2]
MYVEAYRGAPGEEFRSRQEFLRRFAADVQRPGFDMMVASEVELVGCAYGYPPDRAGAWWRGFQGGLPKDVEELTASGQVFAITEMMVLPTRRRSRIATRMQEGLLLRTDAALVTTRFEASNSVARTAYESWGWAKDGDLQATREEFEEEAEGGAEAAGLALEAWSRRPTR